MALSQAHVLALHVDKGGEGVCLGLQDVPPVLMDSSPGLSLNLQFGWLSCKPCRRVRKSVLQAEQPQFPKP